MEIPTNNVPVKVEASNGPERHAKKNGKEDKSRRKDDKSIEQVMKALNVLETTEEKLAAMCKKYTEIVDENRKLQLAAKQWEKGLHTVQREKEQLQTDHSKAVLTRSRLESLCRELQRQNKQIKDESLLKIREEEEKRKEVSAKFNTTLAEITTLMSSSNEKTNLLRDENVEITKKFKSICDQSSIQQQQVDKMNTQRKLESELTEARLTKQRLEFTAEKEVLLKEKQELFMDIHTLHARIKELEASETSLKGQVTLYADRYDEFQTALTKSNEVFGGFKGEMEKMSKKITRLEKETSTWKLRWEKSHQSFLEVVAEKSKCEGELALANRKHAQLEKLCRTLQTERVLLLAQIKGLSQSSSSGDVSVDTATAAHIESAVGKENNSGNVVADEAHNSRATDGTQAAIDNLDNVVATMETVSVGGDLSVATPCGETPESQDDLNALTTVQIPAIHAENQGNKMGDDLHSVHKKGAKSRTGQSDTVKKSKPLSANDVKKTVGDNAKDKKDNARVPGVSKTRHDSASEKKDKKNKVELADKSEIDSANEKQKNPTTDITDTNKIVESGRSEVPARNHDPETSPSVGSTNTTSPLVGVNVEKKELIKDSSKAEEKKANETSIPDKKPEFEKKVTNKIVTEKKQVEVELKTQTADPLSTENKVKVAEETHEKVVLNEVEAMKGPEKEETKFGVLSYAKVSAKNIHVEKKIPDVIPTNIVSTPPTKDEVVNDNVNTTQPEILKEVTETKLPVNDSEIEKVKDVRLTDKIPSAPSNDAKKVKTPEKPKRAEKSRVEGNKGAGDVKVKEVKISAGSVEPSVPQISDEANKSDNVVATPEVERIETTATPVATGKGPDAAEPGPSEMNPNAQQCSDVKKEKVNAKKRKK